MSELLNFTEAAADYIKGMLAKNQGQGFRVSIKKTGCSGFSYAPTIVSEAVEGDLHFIAQDLNVYLDPACVEYVKGLTVDYIEEKKEGSLKQKKLVFINPNEKSRCGCGESFHV
jgi:iron-sulfur cluster assembly accessory protein